MARKFLLFLILLSGCAGQGDIPVNEPAGYIQVKGSETMVSLMQALAEEFRVFRI